MSPDVNYAYDSLFVWLEMKTAEPVVLPNLDGQTRPFIGTYPSPFSLQVGDPEANAGFILIDGNLDRPRIVYNTGNVCAAMMR